MSDVMKSHDCGCQSEDRIVDFLHNGLCAEDAADIRAHIAGCPECQDKHQFSIMLTQVIQRSCHEVAPSELRAAVLTRLRDRQAEHEHVLHETSDQTVIER